MKFTKKISVLLFARNNDEFSIKFLKFLKENYFFVRVIWSTKIGEKLDPNRIKRRYDFIFCFRSYYILNEKVLNKSRIASVNFHPSLPCYRGMGGANLSILNNNKYFGSTAHFISRKIDNGKIISVKKIKILKKDTVESLTIKNYRSMLNHAKNIASYLKDGNIENLNKIIKKNSLEIWAKKLYKKKDLDKFFHIKKDLNKISKKKLDLIIRGTSYRQYQPFIKLHGYIFRLSKN